MSNIPLIIERAKQAYQSAVASELDRLAPVLQRALRTSPTERQQATIDLIVVSAPTVALGREDRASHRQEHDKAQCANRATSVVTMPVGPKPLGQSRESLFKALDLDSRRDERATYKEETSAFRVGRGVSSGPATIAKGAWRVPGRQDVDGSEEYHGRSCTQCGAYSEAGLCADCGAPTDVDRYQVNGLSGNACALPERVSALATAAFSQGKAVAQNGALVAPVSHGGTPKRDGNGKARRGKR